MVAPKSVTIGIITTGSSLRSSRKGSQALQKISTMKTISAIVRASGIHSTIGLLPLFDQRKPARWSGIKVIIGGIPDAVRTVYVLTWAIIVFGILVYGAVGATHN
jgi:hypothetical protein